MIYVTHGKIFESAIAAKEQVLNINNDIHDLTLDFVKDIPNRLNTIEKHWLQFIKNHFDNSVFRELHNEIHKLAGTSAAYGLTQVSQNAKTIESILDEFAANGTLLNQRIEEVDYLLQQLNKLNIKNS